MQNTKLSVSRNGNQSGSRATRPESGGGGGAVAGEYPLTPTLGTGAKSAKRPRVGRAQPKNKGVARGSKLSGPSTTTGRARQARAEATDNQALEAEGLTSGFSSSTGGADLSVGLVTPSERTITSPINTSGSVHSMEIVPPTNERSTLTSVEADRTCLNAAPDISADDATQHSGNVFLDDAAENSGVFYLCEGVGYVDATMTLEP